MKGTQKGMNGTGEVLAGKTTTNDGNTTMMAVTGHHSLGITVETGGAHHAETGSHGGILEMASGIIGARRNPRKNQRKRWR